MPTLALAFEYNGEQHYQYVSVYTDLDIVQQRDRTKELICINNGITLIVVPFWWDRTVESLVATIHDVRPDAVEGEKGIPISPHSPNLDTITSRFQYFPNKCVLIIT